LESVRSPSPEDAGIASSKVIRRGSKTKVHEWLTTSATTPGFIGFAVGRTVFWKPLVEMRDKKFSRDAAVAEVARHYQALVDIFEKART
jgi:myo-inositol catabolism protein IolC